MRYRKKPIVIEAMQNDGLGGAAIIEWSGGAVRNAKPWKDSYPVLEIETLEGTMDCCTGDWVIRGIAGEFYPCKPDIFAATYEEVAE